MQISVHITNQEKFTAFADNGLKVEFTKTINGWEYFSYDPDLDTEWIETELEDLPFHEVVALALEFFGV